MPTFRNTRPAGRISSIFSADTRFVADIHTCARDGDGAHAGAVARGARAGGAMHHMRGGVRPETETASVLEGASRASHDGDLFSNRSRAKTRNAVPNRSRVEPRRTESPSSQVSDTRIAHRRPILIAALAPAPARGGARAPRACARRARGRGPAHGREMARVSGPGLQGSLGRGNERGRRFLRPGRGRARAWTRAADGILRFWFCFFSRRRRDFFVAAVAPGLVSEGRREGEASAQRREVRGVLFAAPAPRAARVGDARGVL